MRTLRVPTLPTYLATESNLPVRVTLSVSSRCMQKRSYIYYALNHASHSRMPSNVTGEGLGEPRP